MYEFFEDEKRYYIVTEYLYLMLILIGFARVVNSSMRSLLEESLLKRTLLFL